MKKGIISIIFAVTMITMAMTTGCSKEKEIDSKNDNNNLVSKEDNQEIEENNEKTSSENNNRNENDVITIGFSIADSSSDNKKMMTDSIRDTFTEEGGYTLLIEDSGENEEQQFTTIRKFIEKDIDYMIVAPLGESKEWETVLEEAKQAEIPVIFVGNKIELENDQLYTAWIGSDYFQEGYDAGDWLEEYLKQKEHNNEEEVQIAMVRDSMDSMAINGRFEGFLEQKEIGNQEHWNIFNYQKESQEKEDIALGISIEKLQELLEQKETINVIVCGNDQIAFEVLKLLDKTEKTYGIDGEIAVISFGASKEGLEAVRDGKINVEIEQNISYGSYVEDIIKRLRTGDEIDKVQYVMEDVFTEENVEEKLAILAVEKLDRSV